MNEDENQDQDQDQDQDQEVANVLIISTRSFVGMTVDEVEKALREQKNWHHTYIWRSTVAQLLAIINPTVDQCDLSNIRGLNEIVTRQAQWVERSIVYYTDHYYKNLVTLCANNIEQLYESELGKLTESNRSLFLDLVEKRRVDRTKEDELWSGCSNLYSLRQYASRMNHYGTKIDEAREKELLGDWAFALQPCFNHIGKTPPLFTVSRTRQ